jgi:hypothetical protein
MWIRIRDEKNTRMGKIRIRDKNPGSATLSVSDELQKNKRSKSLEKPEFPTHLNGGKCEQNISEMPQKKSLPLQFLFSQNGPQCNRGLFKAFLLKKAA